jgi:hypothetical protein
MSHIRHISGPNKTTQRRAADKESAVLDWLDWLDRWTAGPLDRLDRGRSGAVKVG